MARSPGNEALPLQAIAAPASPSTPLSPPPENGSSVTTIQDERRASNASSLPRRLSKSFKESELPPGFLAATADMSSSVYAAAGRSRSGTTRRSSVSSDADDRQPQSPQLQQQQSRDATTTLTILEEHLRSSHSMELQERSRSLDADTSLAKADAEETTIAASRSESQDQQDQQDQQDMQDIEGQRPSRSGGSSSSRSHGASADVDAKTPLTKGLDGVAFATTTVGAGAGAGAGAAGAGANVGAESDAREYDNGYHFPPQYSKSEATRHSAVAFWNYVRTPLGFGVVLYGLNVVAWGGMLFLLLCNAGPAMCHPTCNDINSPRRKWIEVDSQILNGLFCVTGFGLAPWRLRDLFYLLRFRLAHKQRDLRRLAGLHRGWVRLAGSETLPVDVGPGNLPADTPASVIPYPETKVPDAPLTGVRAPPTALWRIDFALWMNAGNTFLQCVLSGFMWGMNRYDRPSWSTGLFVALSCLAGAFGGLMMFVEGKRIKGIEGVPLTDEDYQKLAEDREKGIYHYNSLSGKRPKEKVTDVEARP